MCCSLQVNGLTRRECWVSRAQQAGFLLNIQHTYAASPTPLTRIMLPAGAFVSTDECGAARATKCLASPDLDRIVANGDLGREAVGSLCIARSGFSLI